MPMGAIGLRTSDALEAEKDMVPLYEEDPHELMNDGENPVRIELALDGRNAIDAWGRGFIPRPHVGQSPPPPRQLSPDGVFGRSSAHRTEDPVACVLYAATTAGTPVHV